MSTSSWGKQNTATILTGHSSQMKKKPVSTTEIGDFESNQEIINRYQAIAPSGCQEYYKEFKQKETRIISRSRDEMGRYKMIFLVVDAPHDPTHKYIVIAENAASAVYTVFTWPDAIMSSTTAYVSRGRGESYANVFVYHPEHHCVEPVEYDMKSTKGHEYTSSIMRVSTDATNPNTGCSLGYVLYSPSYYTEGDPIVENLD